MAIAVGKIILPFFVNSWMIIHLGIKPVSGGRPPRDIRVIRIVDTISGFLFHICDSDRVVVLECCMNIMNIGIVMRI